MLSYMKRFGEGLPDSILTPIVVIFVLIVWQFGAPLAGIPNSALPVPSEIFEALIDALSEPTVWQNIRVTSVEVLLGFILAAAAALTVCGVISVFPRFENFIMPYVISTQTIPTVALAPLLLIWFGFGIESKVALAALTAFFPIAINTLNGLKALPEDRLFLLVSSGANRLQLLRMLRVPTALPYIFAGLEIGIIFALLGAVVGEFTGATSGLGYQILVYSFEFNIPGVFATLVLLAILGLVGHGLVVAVRRKVIFWESSPSESRI